MTPPANLYLKKFYLECLCRGAQWFQYQYGRLSKSKLWPLHCLVNSFPLMSSKRFSYVLCSSSKVWTGFTPRVLLIICRESLFEQVSLVIKGCCFPAKKSADSVPWKLQLTHFLKGEDYAPGRLFVAPQDTAALPSCQGQFSMPISCPPARGADILALVYCSTFQRRL